MRNDPGTLLHDDCYDVRPEAPTLMVMASKNALVIAAARSGSTLLGLGLGSHPDAVYAGEIAMWDNKWGRFVDNDLAAGASAKHFGRRGFSPELINPPLPWRPHPDITPRAAEVEAYLGDLLSAPLRETIVGKITFPRRNSDGRSAPRVS